MGHFGQEKTIVIVTRDFYSKGLAEWITDYLRSCDECQHSKSPRHAKYRLLQPLEVPYAAWSAISTDVITQLQQSQGKTQIIVVVDWFTEMVHFIGLQENATAKDVVDTCFREVWKLRRLQTEIILDMDRQFCGEFWESVRTMLGVKWRISTAYQPQTDGQTERTNQVLEGYLQTCVNYDQNDWYQLLPLAEHAYNNSATNAHKMTHPILPQLWFSPTDGVDERQRSSWSQGDNVCSPDAWHTSTGETNFAKHAGIDEEILSQESDRTTCHGGRRLGDVECGECTYQTTVEEGESKTVCPVQSLREERKLGIQVGNIATMEDWSSVSCFAVGTLLSLEQTKLRTTGTRSRKDGGGFGVGSRMNEKRDHFF